MKQLLLALFLLSSTIGFAQTYMVLNTGKVLTVDKNGKIFDLNNFILPYKIEDMGGRFFIDKDRTVSTVDMRGFIYKKGDKKEKAPNKLDAVGENYFVSKRGELFTIDEMGFMFEHKKEKDIKSIVIKGGNFFVAEKRKGGKSFVILYVINHLGQAIESKVEDIDFNSIDSAGGRFFTTTSGELFTVSHDGFVYTKKDMGKFGKAELKKGGNYFVFKDSIYTVAENGVLLNAGPVDFYGSILQMGHNYFVTDRQELYTVNSQGLIIKPDFVENTSHISKVPNL